MQAQGWKHVLIVTDPPHVRRVDWAWGHVLKGTGLQYTLVESSPPWWNASHWWKNKISKDYVISEYKKYAYYILVYGIGIPSEWVSAAGSIVTKDTAPNTVYEGNPAKPIRKRRIS